MVLTNVLKCLLGQAPSVRQYVCWLKGLDWLKWLLKLIDYNDWSLCEAVLRGYFILCFLTNSLNCWPVIHPDST